MTKADHLLLISGFYVLLSWPASWFVGQLIKTYLPPLTATAGIKRAGQLIGILERFIVFTFVVRGQYEAIGLLIAAKSILRFRDQDAQSLTEYVLVGTLLSLFIALAAGEAWRLGFGH